MNNIYELIKLGKSNEIERAFLDFTEALKDKKNHHLVTHKVMFRCHTIQEIRNWENPEGVALLISQDALVTACKESTSAEKLIELQADININNKEYTDAVAKRS